MTFIENEINVKNIRFICSYLFNQTDPRIILKHLFICFSDTFNSSEDLVDTTLNSSQTESINVKKADSSSKNITQTQATAVLGKKNILKVREPRFALDTTSIP